MSWTKGSSFFFFLLPYNDFDLSCESSIFYMICKMGIELVTFAFFIPSDGFSSMIDFLVFFLVKLIQESLIVSRAPNLRTNHIICTVNEQ